MANTRDDTAPYWRVRPTTFYAGVFLNGTYTADIMGCNWTCEGCWSAYGWRTKTAKDVSPKRGGGQFSPSQIVDKLIRGMKRNAMSMARISGGEASLYWDPHMREVLREFIARTKDLRMHVAGATPYEGVDMGIMIETNGSLLTTSHLQELEEEFGEEARRIFIVVGMKATDWAMLAELTGMTDQTAQRFHKQQMETLRWLALKSKYLGWFGNFLDEFCDPAIFAKLQRDLERGRSGSARCLGVDEFSDGYDPNRYWTPKRFRQEGQDFNEAAPARDEEVICAGMGKDGEPKPVTNPDHQLSLEPVDASRLPLEEFSEPVKAMVELDEATAHLPPGGMRAA